MELQGWQRLYLDALLRSRYDRILQYETTSYFASIAHEAPDAVQELLLHRTIAGLHTHTEALELLDVVRSVGWEAYAPRVLARLADTEAILRERPELSDYFQQLYKQSGYTTYSIKDWHLISVGIDLQYRQAPAWSGSMISIDDLLPEVELQNLKFEHLAEVLDYLYQRNIRTFQVGLLTLVASEDDWAKTLHRVLMAPYLQIDAELPDPDSQTIPSLAPQWSPHWKINAHSDRAQNWQIVEAHTNHKLEGLGATKIFDIVSVLLALSGLLREGIQLCPVDDDLIRPVNLVHPIWGFRRRQFAAADTTYQDNDIRSLALGFLEKLPSTFRTSCFRSRLAFNLVTRRWHQRSGASILTAEDGFYAGVVRAAELLGQNRFADLLAHVDEQPYRFEPVYRFFSNEAKAALTLLDRINTLSTAETTEVPKTNKILCVAHASVPDQTGGYALRAHGVLTSLRARGIPVSAVTRPGFPDGVLTDSSTVVVDDVPYRRLPATSVTRQHGEIQYLYSFIEPFKDMFREQAVSVVHLRSTFLIALPALIAARELGLKVLYEVSGLWELVYQDREEPSHLLKRSAFAELAEKITMTNVDQLVVMNEAVRQIAIDRGVQEERIHIAHNAVNVEEFQPLDPPNNEVFTLGYLGSFQDYEGLDDIIDAVKLLAGQGLKVNVVMVGDGLQFKRIRSRVANQGLKPYFTFTGRVPHESVIEHYETMDVLVYPRRSTGATETITPLKPFEALALAKPVIVSDVGPLKEIVGANERGLVFESGNIEDFARCIRKFHENADLMAELGRAGRAWVEKYRDWNNVVETFEDAYRGLHEMSGPRG
jgi:glycosyltransferase involved in cell wall biosynthesis